MFSLKTWSRCCVSVVAFPALDFLGYSIFFFFLFSGSSFLKFICTLHTERSAAPQTNLWGGPSYEPGTGESSGTDSNH